MLAVSTIFLLFALSTANGRLTFIDKCPHDTIDFATKVDNSTFVVLGKSTGKYLDATRATVFRVLFEVECVLKGSTIPKFINITEAGQVEGRTYCQDFPVGRGYSIVFLERDLLDLNDTNTFIPADFVEVPYLGNVTDELLANTCGLHRLLPLESSVSIVDVCPVVSTTSHCIQMLELTSSGVYPVVIQGGAVQGIDIIRSKSGVVQVQVDTKNGVGSISISILLLIMVMIFAQMN